MRLLIAGSLMIVALTLLGACGYRTPLTLPKPDAKPPATAPAPAAGEAR
jgi:predicted small lipoprotein YifL